EVYVWSSLRKDAEAAATSGICHHSSKADVQPRLWSNYSCRESMRTREAFGPSFASDRTLPLRQSAAPVIVRDPKTSPLAEPPQQSTGQSHHPVVLRLRYRTQAQGRVQIQQH